MSWLRRVRRGLALRIVLPLAAALVAVFFGASVYLGRTVRDEGLRELRQRGNLLAETLSDNAELPMLARDGETMRALLESAARDPDLVSAEIVDERGQPVASFRPRPDSGPAAGRAMLNGRAKGTLTLSSPILTEATDPRGREDSAFALDRPADRTKPLGEVRVVVSTATTAARTASVQRQIALAVSGLLLLCIGLGVMIVRAVSRPLRQLVGATRHVAAGDLSVAAAPSSIDEISSLSEAFNRMTEDLRAARQEVLAERAELERRVAARTAELERAQETLLQSQTLSAVGQLVAGVAHELNNPLTVVLGTAELLVAAGSEDGERRRKLGMIVSEADRARKIVRNLLTFARRGDSRKEPADLNEIVERTVELRQYDLRNQNVRFDAHLARELPAILADFHELQQVVLNLLVNAEQAMSDSGKGTTIHLATRRDGAEVEFVIEDDGPGIPAAVRARIFEPFYTTKPVGRGTGLGLAICYGIVTDHGGSIRVESEEGRFTRFLLRLPASGEAPVRRRPSEEASRRPADPGAPFRVLVIDDDPAVLCFLEDALRMLGATVETAQGGRAGLKRLQANGSWDLVVTDLRMPDVDGRQIHDHLRRFRPDLLPAVVFSTGDIASADATGFLERAGCAVLQKPFTLQTLSDLLETRRRAAPATTPERALATV